MTVSHSYYKMLVMAHLNLYPICQKNEQLVNPPSHLSAPEAHHSTQSDSRSQQSIIPYIRISASIAITFVTCRVRFVANRWLDLIL